MGGRGSSSGGGSGGGGKQLKSMDVWHKADEMAEILVDLGKASYAKVNVSEAKHPENGIDRVYYSISKFKNKGRGRSKHTGTIPLGYYDNKTKKYVPKQVGGHEATNVFDYVRKNK